MGTVVAKFDENGKSNNGADSQSASTPIEMEALGCHLSTAGSGYEDARWPNADFCINEKKE